VESKSRQATRTKAELAFEKVQERRVSQNNGVKVSLSLCFILES